MTAGRSNTSSAPSASIASTALFRGINVGTAKRVAMADLRALFVALGCQDVRTLLNSGNVVFTGSIAATGAAAAARIEAALAKRTGVTARVTVLSAKEVAEIVAGNPLARVANDPARLLVSVFRDAAAKKRLAPLADRKWGREAFALGERAAYLWCADGVRDSALWAAADRELGDALTSRNWSTVLKLVALVAEETST